MSLYGVVVLLEWIYARLLTHPAGEGPAVSLVLRVVDQEGQIEHAIRQLVGWWGESGWRARGVELIVSDGGSSDQTLEIVDRLSRRYGFLVVLTGLDPAAVLERCGNPVVIWVELSRANPAMTLMATVHRLLAERPDPMKSPVA